MDGVAVRTVVALLLFTQSVAQPLEREIHAVASGGEPRHVSAAAITRDGVRLSTLENASAFELTFQRRAVIVPAVDAAPGTSATILAAVRWFKTKAPASVRKQWIVSALLAVDASEIHQLSRWIAFQAPDLIIEVGSSTPTWPAVLTADRTTGLGDVPVTTAPIEIAIGSAVVPSPLRARLTARASRPPLSIARLLAATYPQASSMSYIPAVSWVGMLRLSSVTGEAQWAARAREQLAPWLSGERPLFGQRIQLTAVAGTMVFAELARTLSASSSSEIDRAARRLAVDGATRAAERNAAGLAEYGGGWTDDMFMATSVLARTASVDGRRSDLDAAADLLIDYAGRLQRPDGLFIHAAQMPAAWGRGNGFAALALMEALTVLPVNHARRSPLLTIYRRQMQALADAQAPDGAWRNVIDEPGAYREQSATAMLFVAMARGIRLGWLDRTQYWPVAQRAWAAVAVHVTEVGGVVDVCESTPGGPTTRYYLDRKALTGSDDRGGAMALLAALERYELGR